MLKKLGVEYILHHAFPNYCIIYLGYEENDVIFVIKLDMKSVEKHMFDLQYIAFKL